MYVHIFDKVLEDASLTKLLEPIWMNLTHQFHDKNDLSRAKICSAGLQQSVPTH